MKSASRVVPLSHIDRILEDVNHGITAETSAASATSIATKAHKLSQQIELKAMGETSLKPFKAILETIREQADLALKQLQDSDEELDAMEMRAPTGLREQMA